MAQEEALAETPSLGAEVSIYSIKLESTGVDRHNIASVLRDSGYYTGQVGKWHLMPAGAADGTCSSMTESAAEESSYDACTEEVKELGFDFVDGWFFANIKENDDFSHNPEWMVSQAQRFIDEAKDEDKPFFLYLATTLLHSPSAITALTDFDLTASPKGVLHGADIPDDTAMTPREDILSYLEEHDLMLAKPAGFIWIDDSMFTLISHLPAPPQHSNILNVSGRCINELFEG